MKRGTAVMGHQDHDATTWPQRDGRVSRKIQSCKRNQSSKNSMKTQKKPPLLLIQWKNPPLFIIKKKKCTLQLRNMRQ